MFTLFLLIFTALLLYTAAKQAAMLLASLLAVATLMFIFYLIGSFSTMQPALQLNPYTY